MTALNVLPASNPPEIPPRIGLAPTTLARQRRHQIPDRFQIMHWPELINMGQHGAHAAGSRLEPIKT